MRGQGREERGCESLAHLITAAYISVVPPRAGKSVFSAPLAPSARGCRPRPAALPPLPPPPPPGSGPAGRLLHRPGCSGAGARLQICPDGTAATSQPVIAKQTRLKYWIGLNRDKIYAFAANLFVQLYLKALD